MRKITFINSQGDSIEFSDAAPFILTKFDTSNNLTIYGHKSHNQDGRTYTENTLDPKESTIEVLIEARTRDHLAACRSKINKILSPKLGEGYMIGFDGATERRLKCIVDRLPYFVDVSPLYAECLISLESNDPFFKDIAESKTDVSTEEGNLAFPLEIPAEGLELSIRTINFITNIYNQGDVDTPIRVMLKATGTVINPIIENLDTGEFIRIKRTLLEGESLEINTAFGNKRVELIHPDGSKGNVFHYIDYKSRFFSLGQGDNTIKYDAEAGENNLDVSIYYTPKYLGI